MDQVIYVNKPIGQTPLQAIVEFKRSNPKYLNEKISYAGRLDPMAKGVLVLLVGDANKRREYYQGMEKEYQVEAVLGIGTDSYDLLGAPGAISAKLPTIARVREYVRGFENVISQKYPPYSSKPVNGRPLFWWARRNRLNEIEIPHNRIRIYNSRLLSFGKVDLGTLILNIKERIDLVEGDFRQNEIKSAWDKLGFERKEMKLVAVTLMVKCSSGTYIRSLVQKMGEELGCGSFVYEITRTRVGIYKVIDCANLYVAK